MRVYIFILVAILALFTASATSQGLSEGNAGYFTGDYSNTSFIAYSGALNNNVPNSTYTVCDLPASTGAGLAIDIDGDNVPEIIQAEAYQYLRFYDIYTCDLEAEIDTGIKGAGGYNNLLAVSVAPLYGDAYYDIILHDTTSIQTWKNTGAGFNKMSTLNVSSLTSVSGWQLHGGYGRLISMACMRIESNNIDSTQSFTCTAIYGLDGAPYTVGALTFDPEDSTHYRFNNITTTYTHLFYGNESISWDSMSRYTSLYNARQAIFSCDGYSGTTTKVCMLVNSSGALVWQTTMPINNTYGWFESHNDFTAKLGSSFFNFFSSDSSATGGRMAKFYDTSGSEIVAIGSDAQARLSNWMIGDFDKDGVNEACILFNRTSYINFSCYDSSGNQKESYAVNWSLGTLRHGVAMADFSPESDYLGLASQWGIFYPDNDTWIQVFSGASEQEMGTTNVFNLAYSGVPVVHIAGKSVSYIIRNQNFSAECGDGICSEDFENCFSCASDCECASSQVTCLGDSDCPTYYPTCYSNECVAGYTGITCLYSGDCPLNASLCFEGTCIQAVSGGSGSIDPVTGAVPSADQADINDAITGTIGLLTGTSPLLRLLLALAAILGAMFAAMRAMQNPNPMVVMGVGIVVAIALSMVGMIPVYFLILLLIGGFLVVLGERHLLNNNG